MISLGLGSLAQSQKRGQHEGTFYVGNAAREQGEEQGEEDRGGSTHRVCYGFRLQPEVS